MERPPNARRTGVLALIVLSAAGSVLAQSLAEVAAAEKKRREQSRPAKTFTNEDLDRIKKRSPGAPPARPVRQPNQEQGAARRGEETSWRARASESREALGAARAKLAKAQAELAALDLDRQPSPTDLLDPNRLQARERAKTAARERVEQARAELAAAEQALEDLKEEARRKRIPPGWLRES